MAHKWIYKTIHIDEYDIDTYVSYIKQGYCVFAVNKNKTDFLCSEFLSQYEQNKDDDYLFEYGYLLKVKEFQEEEDALKHFSIMNELADRKYLKAYQFLGRCYYDGYGVEQDFDKAIYYFELGAKEDFIPAINCLAVHYYYGKGVKKDLDKAFSLFKKCADAGYATAQTNVALSYYTADCVPQDYEKALHYASLAAAQDDARAHYILGQMYLEGIGVEEDHDEGFYHMYKAYLLYYKRALQYIGYLQYESQLLYQNKLWYKIDDELLKD